MLTWAVHLGAVRFGPDAASLWVPLALIAFVVCVGAVIFPLLGLAVASAWGRLRSRRSRHRRVDAAANAEARARAMMGELCPHGWRAQVTLFADAESDDHRPLTPDGPGPGGSGLGRAARREPPRGHAARVGRIGRRSARGDGGRPAHRRDPGADRARCRRRRRALARVRRRDAMGIIFGGVETGGTWVVCALGTGPEDIVAQETFATGEPGPTLERIAAFFERGPSPAAIGVGSFGPVDLDPGSAHLGARHQHPEARLGPHAGGARAPRPARRPGPFRHRRHHRGDRRASLGRSHRGRQRLLPDGRHRDRRRPAHRRPPGPRPHPPGGGAPAASPRP